MVLLCFGCVVIPLEIPLFFEQMVIIGMKVYTIEQDLLGIPTRNVGAPLHEYREASIESFDQDVEK